MCPPRDAAAPPDSPGIHYRLELCAPRAHRLRVHCHIPQPDPRGQRLMLPSWTPGSYLLRDYARHVIRLSASAAGQSIALHKRDSHTWEAPPGVSGPLEVVYEVYAHELSVRGAYIDTRHAFIHGAAVFLQAVGHGQRPHHLELCPPADPACADWQVATSLPPAEGPPGAPSGYGHYQARDYDELLDHPIELGRFSRHEFVAGGIPHALIVTGAHDGDAGRLAADLARICATQIAFFGDAPPMPNYLFLLTLVENGYNGLEHRAATALTASRHDLPARGLAADAAPDKNYRKLLGLCSHEYFHSWNVKRIRPAVFIPYDLQRPAHTRLLWFFEGVTSYYDDLFLLRSGVINRADYLELLGETLARVEQTPGRHLQSVADSSFDAWTRFYKPDENTANTQISYYAKGALVALGLDLLLRQRSAGERSLDSVMQRLWQRYGQRDPGPSDLGLDEASLQAEFEQVAEGSLADFFDRHINGTEDVPLDALLAPFGMSIVRTASNPRPSLGIQYNKEAAELRLNRLISDGPAMQAGLAAGDQLLALDGRRVSPQTLEARLDRLRPGETVSLTAFRDDELLHTEAVLAPPLIDSVRLQSGPESPANALCEAWLRTPIP